MGNPKGNGRSGQGHGNGEGKHQTGSEQPGRRMGQQDEMPGRRMGQQDEMPGRRMGQQDELPGRRMGQQDDPLDDGSASTRATAGGSLGSAGSGDAWNTPEATTTSEPGQGQGPSGEQTGDDNIREGRVGGSMGTQHQSRGQGQGG